MEAKHQNAESCTVLTEVGSGTRMKLGKYKHFKGEVMEVIGTAFHSETQEEFVIYKHITGKRVGEPYYWVRPIGMFLENVKVDGKEIPRFEFVG